MRVALTGQGVRFLLLIGVVGFAAYNNQNNLLYLMTSVGIASVLVGVVAGWASLRGLTFVGAEAADAYADVPFREKLFLASSARAFHAFGLDVESGESAIAFLRTGARGSCEIERVYRRRGRYRGEPVRVATRFPFGLFRVRRRLDARREVLVFPRLRPVDTSLLDSSYGGVLPRAQRRGQSDEFFRLREYVAGDHIHHIHWKTSAKLDGMMVREFGEDEEERVCLCFVSVFANEDDTSEFEHLVSAAASLAVHLASSGVRFRFIADDIELDASSSLRHTREILTYLAEVQPTGVVSPTVAELARRASSEGETVIVVSVDESVDFGTVLTPGRILRAS